MSRKQKFYAVKGYGVFDTWEEARGYCIDEETGKPFKYASFRKFGTASDARVFLGEGKQSYKAPKAHQQRSPRAEPFYSGTSQKASDTGRRSAFPRSTLQQSNDYSSQSTMSNSRTASSRRSSARGSKKNKPIVVYTDGACSNNGRQNARAGYGVYFGPDDARNESAPLQGQPQTNQRAELTAILRAIEKTEGEGRPVEIYTDSQYSMKCVTDWMPKWEQNNFRNAAGKPVANQDLIVSIYNKMQENDVNFKYVPGHSGDAGNEAADLLARLGAEDA